MVWKKATEILIGGKIPLSVYHSNRSNLRVFVAKTPGPVVEGRITFVTETHTNDGLPHTLEHLVFMGSHRYPYKGMLDIIANRCLASGTNAFTEQDHTSYELVTAGSSGFLKILPVYLDHLLKPTLNESQYITEVHHINGQGQNSGVVYSEMQPKNSEMDYMVDKKRRELFYPDGSSYRAMTGGILSDIRELCSLERVRNYHKNFYHLSNMYITVCGQIDHQKLLDCIEPIEQQNLDSIPRHFVAPFQARVPPLTEPKSERIVCPSDDESIGMVEMSWLGPPGFDVQTTYALSILFDYLTETAVAPMRKDFVQMKDPFCTSVGIYLMEQSDSEIVALFDGVPVDKLDMIRDRFFEKTVIDHQLPEAFDVQRIGFILDQQIRQFNSKLENRSTSLIASAVTGHQLFGRTDDPHYKILEEYLNEANLSRQLKAQPAEFWHSLFHKWLANKNCVCVMAEPSEKMVKQHEKMEAERINQQIIQLGGNEGLKKCQKRLDDAIEDNTCKRPTNEDLADLIVRDFEKFSMVDVSISTNLAQHSNAFVSKFPFTVVLHTVPSDFFDANIIIDTEGVSTEDRYFLLLWFELMFQSPAIVEGKELNYEEVAKLSTRDLVSQTVSVGISGVYDRFMTLRLRTGAGNVSNLAKWANIYLKGLLFRSDRIAICARNLANNAAESKRDGDSVCHFLNACSSYSSDANTYFSSYLALEKFHKGIAKAVENGRSDEVVGRLEAVRQRILAGPMNVHFSGDPSRIQIDGGAVSLSASDMATQWAFLKQPVRPLLQCPPEHGATMAFFGQSRAIAVGGSDSAYLLQKTRFEDDWNGTGTMPTLLLSQYLAQSEGPLWNAVRGTGLAYHVGLYVMPDRRTLSLELYRCSQLGQAYEKTRDTVLNVLDGNGLDPILLESAKRSLVCELITSQNTIKQTVTSAILATLRSVGTDFTLKLCSQVWHAKPEDVLAIGGPPIRQLFDLSKSVRSIALNSSRQKELKQHFPETKIIKLDELQVKKF